MEIIYSVLVLVYGTFVRTLNAFLEHLTNFPVCSPFYLSTFLFFYIDSIISFWGWPINYSGWVGWTSYRVLCFAHCLPPGPVPEISLLLLEFFFFTQFKIWFPFALLFHCFVIYLILFIWNISKYYFQCNINTRL